MKKFAAFSLGILLILNLLDAVFTLHWVELGLGVEQNPLMRELLERGAICFMLGKLALVSLGAWFMWIHLKRRLAQVGAILITLVYAGVFCWHLWGFTL